ncbi:methylated-DNA--[protein]-cysteine S-methyltransferase [Paraliobacillus sp. JSM ZJ581]|uniref:methylated-DNA--[protein]-cysteine S-methyltransferase n=1 Tax=Paraliobacillus sp. JSM ZJ581 TaxID=3342118 RepID=UPI0035A83FE6
MANILYYDYISKDNDMFLLVASERGLCYVGLSDTDKDFWDKWKRKFYPTFILKHDPKEMAVYSNNLTAYFNGEVTVFSLSVDVSGTVFQKQVWKALQLIPYGETTNYSALAMQINRLKAIRAVANAVASNPLLIVIPCHRVMGKDGSLTGFRSGIRLKKKLLKLEAMS